MKLGARPVIGAQAGNFDCSSVITFLPEGPSNRSTSGVRACSTTSPPAELQSSVVAHAPCENASSATLAQIPVPDFMLPAPPQFPDPELPPVPAAACRPSRDADSPRSNPGGPPVASP